MSIERPWNDVREEQLTRQMDVIQADTTKSRMDDRIAAEYKRARHGEKYSRPRVNWKKLAELEAE